MAKDGTNRGGARLGAGAKKKPLADKIAEGNPGKRNITVINFENAAELEGQEMPRPSETENRCRRRKYIRKRGSGSMKGAAPL